MGLAAQYLVGQVKKLEAASIQTLEALASLDHPIRSMAEYIRLLPGDDSQTRAPLGIMGA